jgi:hypothetical protein
MARLVIVIDTTDSIAELNSKLDLSVGGNPDEHVAKIANYIAACQSGVVDASMQVTSRGTDPGVTTQGAGSLQQTFDLA